jgi:hypothetical protein
MRKAFIVCHEEWYSGSMSSQSPTIMIGDYPSDGGTRGEFAIRWHDIGGSPSPRLEVFDDSWLVFLAMPDMIGLLLLNCPTPDDVKRYLLNCGFEDITSRKQPKADGK